MNKHLTRLTKASMATLLATSALIPVAVQAAEVQQEITEVGLKTTDDKIAKLSLEVYKKALIGGAIKAENVTHVVATNGKAYSIESYKQALIGTNGDVAKALEILEEKNAEDKNTQIFEGEIKDGELVAKDEIPEEKVNETFFYNFAA